MKNRQPKTVIIRSGHYFNIDRPMKFRGLKVHDLTIADLMSKCLYMYIVLDINAHKYTPPTQLNNRVESRRRCVMGFRMRGKSNKHWLLTCYTVA